MSLLSSRLIHIALAVPMFLAACSDGHKDESCDESNCSIDAGGQPTTSTKPTKDGGVIRENPLTPDAASDELQAHLQVNGAHTQCGTCAVVLAQAQGGVLPYTYTWSDPTLVGPGPHMVCPSAPTEYSVVIADSTPTVSGEFATTTQQVEAKGSVDCVEDAGVAGEALLGCESSSSTTPADGGVTDMQMTCAEPGDAGVTFDFTMGARGTVTTSTRREKVFKAGQTYEYSQDRLLPLTLTTGDSIKVDVYSAKSHCSPLEKMFTLTWDIFTWHQSFCFTPKEDFQYVIIAVHLNGALFSWELVSGGTLCTGCSTAP